MIEYTRRVYYYETDKMGIVHHSNYIRYMEEARVYALDVMGYNFRELERRGLSSPVTGVECSFKKPLQFDDEFTVRVWGKATGSAVFEICYDIVSGGEVCAKGKSRHCFMENGRPVNLKKKMQDFLITLERS